MAFVQAVHASNDAAGTVLNVAITATTSNLFACQSWDNVSGAGGMSITDGGNVFTPVDDINSAGAITQQTFYAKNITGGARTVALASTSAPFRRIQVAEYSGLDTTAPLEDHKAAVGTSTGGANAETSGNGTGTVTNGCTIVGFFLQFSDTVQPTQGTGFTSRDPFNNAAGDASDVEDRVQATAGTPDAGTWTLAVGKSEIMSMLAFKPAATGVLAAPLMPTMIWGRNKILRARPHVDANISVLNNYILPAVTGVYTYAGSAASTLTTRLLAAATGVYSLSGIAALVAFGHKLFANTGVYTLTGSAASVLATRLLAATKGTFTLTGNAAATLYKRILIAGTGVFTLTGIAASFARTYVLAAASGVFSLVGQAASVVYSGGIATAISEWVRRRRGRN